MILHNFVVFEGIDGSGTSTQIERLKKRLSGKKAVFTAEPTKLETGIFLRRVLSGEIKLAPATAARLFAADRCEHLYGAGGIVETCKTKLCVCDRYLFSSLAYQSVECGIELPAKLNEDFPLPQIVFYFCIQPEAALKRITGRGITEIYEKKDFLEKTAAAYDKIFADFETTHTDMTIVRIDASRSADKTEKIIWGVIQKMPILEL